jgi:hypothetical protein
MTVQRPLNSSISAMSLRISGVMVMFLIACMRSIHFYPFIPNYYPNATGISIFTRFNPFRHYEGPPVEPTRRCMVPPTYDRVCRRVHSCGCIRLNHQIDRRLHRHTVHQPQRRGSSDVNEFFKWATGIAPFVLPAAAAGLALSKTPTFPLASTRSVVTFHVEVKRGP